LVVITKQSAQHLGLGWLTCGWTIGWFILVVDIA